MNMRGVLFSLSTLLLWASTVSIHFDNPPPGISPAILPCPEKGEGEILLNYLYTGSISAIRDNGRILTIGLSPHWSTLPSGLQNDTYQAVACYAQSQQRAFHLTDSP